MEIGAKGIHDLTLSYDPRDSETSKTTRVGFDAAAAAEQSIWVLGAIGFLMVAWGMSVLGAGLLMSGMPSTTRNSLTNGSPPALRVGGVSVILIGVMLLTLAATRNRNFRRGLTHLVRWGGIVVSLAVSCYAIATGGISRNPLPVGWAICLPAILSGLAHVLDETLNGPAKVVNPWEFPVVFYSETSHPEKPKKRI